MTESNNIRTLLVPSDPREGCTYTFLDMNLAAMQAYVGGYVEAKETPSGAMAYFNEDGAARALPVNGRASRIISDELGHPLALVGNVMFVGAPDENGDETDLSLAFITTHFGTVFGR